MGQELVQELVTFSFFFLFFSLQKLLHKLRMYGKLLYVVIQDIVSGLYVVRAESSLGGDALHE